MMAPVLIGLPEIGVTLAGDPTVPAIVNNANRSILGCSLWFECATGYRCSSIKLSLLALRSGNLSGVIRPGTQRTSPIASQTPPAPVGNLVKVVLDAVLFEDGEVAGPDTSNTFQIVSAKVSAEQDLHRQLLAARQCLLLLCLLTAGTEV